MNDAGPDFNENSCFQRDIGGLYVVAEFGPFYHLDDNLPFALPTSLSLEDN